MTVRQQRVIAHLAALGLSLPDERIEQLLAYLDLLLKWNRVYNLTAIRNADEALDLHLLDSLTLLPHITVPRIADIGAGGGLPGLVLAICQPELEVHLVDTVAKKCTFMRQAAAELALKNVSVHHTRVEAWQVTEKFPAITSRAFAELADFVHWTRHLLADDGQWLAMKGAVPHEEIAALPADVRVAAQHPLSLPGRDVQRHLIVLAKT